MMISDALDREVNRTIVPDRGCVYDDEDRIFTKLTIKLLVEVARRVVYSKMTKFAASSKLEACDQPSAPP